MASQQVAILGLGLIGSSLGLALKRQASAPLLIGFDPDQGVLHHALGVGAIDRAAPAPGQAIRDMDTIILAAPVRSILRLLEEFGPQIPSHVLVTDTGSTKVQIVEQAARCLASGAGFVGGHPLAGRLQSGVNDADGRLFAGSLYCLSPTPATPAWALERATELVEGIGAVPYFLDAEEHDALLAAISHLPYFASAALVEAVGSQSAWSEMGNLAAGGFRAVTSVVDASPEMWTDIGLTNAGPLLRQLDALIEQLGQLRQLIADGEAEQLSGSLHKIRDLHRDWLASRGEPQMPAAPAPSILKRLPFFR